MGQIYRESCKCTPGRQCTPEAEQESIFLGNWGDVDSGTGYLGSFNVCFEGDRRRQKSRQLWGEEVHAQTKSWLSLCLKDNEC